MKSLINFLNEDKNPNQATPLGKMYEQYTKMRDDLKNALKETLNIYFDRSEPENKEFYRTAFMMNNNCFSLIDKLYSAVLTQKPEALGGNTEDSELGISETLTALNNVCEKIMKLKKE